MFETDRQTFASVPSVPRGFTLQNFGPPSAGDHRRTGGGASQPTPPPPLFRPLEGPVRWCALRAPRTNGAAAPHPGTFPGRSQGREALSAPWDPSTCHQRPRPWECGTQLVQQRHLCQQAVKERGSPPVVPGAHPSPCVRSRGTGGQRVSVTRRMRCPGPLLPGGLSVRLPWPAPPGLEHQATLAPHTQGPAPAHTPARARAYTQDDGIFRPPALRWGLVAVDSPLGLGTGQSGCSASWWGREGSPHLRACSCMRPPAQPNPTPLFRPPPTPPKRLSQIFFRAFGRSKKFPGAFGANEFRPEIFFCAFGP